eukprot:3188101-Alexandrium_andersonii.AAC.1
MDSSKGLHWPTSDTISLLAASFVKLVSLARPALSGSKLSADNMAEQRAGRRPRLHLAGACKTCPSEPPQQAATI